MRKRIFKTTTIALALTLTMAVCAPYVSAQTQPDAGATPTQVQQPQDGGVNWPGVGYGVGALFANVLYLPAKLVYALLGSFVGGGTYVLTAGNTQAADTVWRSSLGGDYVVTPQMLAGQQPINFSGPTETAPVPASSASSANGGTVAPIQPIPPSSSAAQPLDHGSGPASGTNIE